MKSSESIQRIRRRATPIFRRYGVRKVAVFGSFARGEERKTSDVDFLVKLPSSMGLFEFSGLKIALEECLKRKVDLVSYGYIHPFLRQRILKERIIIYEKRS